MRLTQWDPMRDIDAFPLNALSINASPINALHRQMNQDMNREMNRLFDQLVALPRTRSLSANVFGADFVPAAEISDTEEAYRLRLELPGLTPEDLEIQVTADSVVIKGERHSESEQEQHEHGYRRTEYRRTEFRYGKFERTIALPGQVQNTEVKADYRDGILTLNLPKAESEKNKVVKIEVTPSAG